MTPKQLYAMTPQFVEHDITSLAGSYYNHIPEAGDSGEWMWQKTLISDRIEIRVLKHFDFDGRRFWRLATVWFDGKPVMVIQNAGREGDDHAKRYVTNYNLLLEMAAHIRSLIVFRDTTNDQVSEDTDFNELTDFYGNYLEGPFERSS